MEIHPKVGVMDLACREEHAHAQQAAQQAGLRFATADELLELAEPALYSRLPRLFLDAHRLIPVARQTRT